MRRPQPAVAVMVSSTPRSAATSTCVIKADVPLSEMFGYTTILRGLTQGRATSTMEPAEYRLMPDRLRDEVLARA